MSIRLEFKPADCWIGAFVRRTPVKWPVYANGSLATRTGYRYEVWVCILPMLPIRLAWLREDASAW